jgi:3-methylcrotonyl-CoA carboxylase alpha subunit
VVDGRRVHGRVITDADGLTVFHNGRQHRFRVIQHTLEEEESVATGSVTAPMPGRILSLSVAEGDRVERGTTLLVLEAMKMEHSLKAPGDGTVTEVRVGVDDLVQEGAELIRIEPAG